jgi:hypothetical protein
MTASIPMSSCGSERPSSSPSRFGRVKTRGYAKATDGPQYLQRIAQEESLRSVVFASNRYLHDIVEDLASL